MANRFVKVVPDPAAVATTAAKRIVDLADDAIATRGSFSIALSGGSTPKTLFELLATEPYSKRIDWKNWRFYFGDERTVPPTHSDSNFRMASEAMLDKLAIPADHIHRMRGEIDPQESAKEYGELLKANFGDNGLDVILLGMGDDGHTASLFPNTAALSETKHRCVANHVEKLNTWRITMTAPFINRARQIIVMATGANKADRLHQVLDGPPDTRNLPIQMIDPPAGQALWLLDAPAAAKLATN
ncbi:MAG TPA: 6-phosphogluconolactonase [Tepidisphaeraceae bacterium]|jgi:6-phosphogluconolactonase